MSDEPNSNPPPAPTPPTARLVSDSELASIVATEVAKATAHFGSKPNTVATMPAAPAPLAAVGNGLPGVLQWSQGQLDAHIAENYPVPSMPWHPKNAAARRELAAKVHKAMANTMIATGYRGGK